MTAISLPRLPKWTDAGSVASFLVAALSIAFGILGAIVKGLHEPAWLPPLVPVVALAVATAAVAVNVVTHRKAHASALGVLAQSVVPADLSALAKEVAPLLSSTIDPNAIAHQAAAIVSAQSVLSDGAAATTPASVPTESAAPAQPEPAAASAAPATP